MQHSHCEGQYCNTVIHFIDLYKSQTLAHISYYAGLFYLLLSAACHTKTGIQIKTC